jgi:hypothetical protein
MSLLIARTSSFGSQDRAIFIARMYTPGYETKVTNQFNT